MVANKDLMEDVITLPRYLCGETKETRVSLGQSIL